MAEPVSTISALHALSTKLIDSIQDRKTAAEVREIQRLISVLQGEHFELKERNLQLVAENLELKAKIIALETKALDAEKTRAESHEEIVLHKGVEFRKGKKTGNAWAAFCPLCHRPAFTPQFTFRLLCSDDSCNWNGVQRIDLEQTIAEVKKQHG